ncbi:MAG: peptidoglycan DD-metalloendopeptidase family protein [Synergistaceae bacterium]|nr:peptidoglycan DD-metalloendopeptidase family protein [Synergistaceae bacterium]
MLKRVIFLLALILLTVNASNIDKQIRTQKQNQADMKKRIEQYNKIARQKSKESKSLLSQLSRLRQNASESESRMNDLQRENSKLQASVAELNRNIARVSESMNHILTMLRGRLTELYKHSPDGSGINAIFSAGGPHEAVNTAYMLNIFARNDLAMFAALNAREKELAQAKAKLESDKKKITSQTDELRKKREEFDSAVRKTDTLLKNVQSEQKKAESAAKELESAQRAVGSKITNLMNKKKRASAMKITPSKSGGKNSNVGGSKATVPVNSAGSSPQRSVNSLAWPMTGRVTMQYGSRVHPTFKTKIFNSGIDIAAAAGTPVKASGPGEVLYQGWLRGLGQVVIIDHGGDLTTVYAHLGRTSVREGARVSTGTVIGSAGNTGTDAEYGLHFEVRKNGSAVNPMNYLRR